MTRQLIARNAFLYLALASAAAALRPSLAPAAEPAEDAARIDLRSAQVVVPLDVSGPERKAVEMLLDEIAKRTRVRLPIANAWPADAKTPVIAVGQASALRKLDRSVADALGTSDKPGPPEGYRLKATAPSNGPQLVLVAGNDARGVLFGVGRFLRSLHLSRDRIEAPASLDITTAPAMAIRGHQLGYRPKTNSYDAWDLRQWEQYIRDLAVFGCNSIELIPPRSDDDPDSPHFPLPQMEMMIGMSQLAADYGIDLWIWYPAMEARYATPAAIDAAVKEWGEVLAKLPRVDAVFVPSGDPGDSPPAEFMAMVAKQAEQLKRLHPQAKMWVSVQGFTRPQFDEMLAILKQQLPWLGGVVYGPQTPISIAELRAALPKGIPIRGYPDITHSMRCEYPVPDWDRAYAMTEGREVINPRPVDETIIFQRYRDNSAGVITYSEGCNDDVNKALWSALCWNPDAQPIDTLRDFARYFIGDEHADDSAQGLLALERNWRGPLLTNDAVTSTLEQFQKLEATADPRMLRNWRFQQALYRAYYDAYLHRRLIEETAQEAATMEVLQSAREIGVARALDQAERILDRASMEAKCDPLTARVNELAEALFQSVGMQLSVSKYKAIDVDRGANLDQLNVPLNNRVWLKRRFAGIRKLASDEEQLRAVHEILHWTDPGPGGFYDDLGNPAMQPHFVRDVDCKPVGKWDRHASAPEDFRRFASMSASQSHFSTASYSRDPAYFETPTIGFESDLAWRRSWCDHVDGLYHTPVVMHYPHLDPTAAYKLRVVYAGDEFDAKVRLVAMAGEREIEVHPFIAKPQPVRPVEFEIPRAATAKGDLRLKWLATPERGGPGRGCQIAEAWLVKTKSK
jgi:hypothetical protein